MLGCFNPNLRQIWTNPNLIKKNVQLNVKAEVGLKYLNTVLTQHFSLSIFDPNLG